MEGEIDIASISIRALLRDLPNRKLSLCTVFSEAGIPPFVISETKSIRHEEKQFQSATTMFAYASNTEYIMLKDAAPPITAWIGKTTENVSRNGSAMVFLGHLFD